MKEKKIITPIKNDVVNDNNPKQSSILNFLWDIEERKKNISV